jgi:hypothetical protein
LAVKQDTPEPALKPCRPGNGKPRKGKIGENKKMGKNGQAREVGKLVIVFYVIEASGSSAGPGRHLAKLSWKRGAGGGRFLRG